METILNNSHTEPTSYTLLGAMRRLLTASAESHLERKLYSFESQNDGELEYLTSRLGITDDAAVLFSILCEKGAQQRIQLYDIGRHLGCGTLEILQHKPNIDTLVEKGLVVEEPAGKYFVPDEVLQALCRNEVWSDSVQTYTSDGNLCYDLFERFNMAAGNRISKTTLYEGVMRLLEANAGLRFAKVMGGYRKVLDDDEFMFLMSLVCLWLVRGARWSTFENASKMLRDRTATDRLRTTLMGGTSPLLTSGIIKPCPEESFADKPGYALTAATRRKINSKGLQPGDPQDCPAPSEDVFTFFQDPSEENSQILVPDKIVKRQLFYNDTTARQVKELATLLREKKMRSVLRRLKSSGLRCGFTCLFHGGPGTGKTETVLQLARDTGRAVFQVDVSKLRTKWYGESERLVKGVFDDYRRMVAQSAVAPIMLFNEADAIFNRRMEAAEHSVDKNENALQNIILQEMENLDGILIATTNLATNLDKAFERRFLYKIEFESPDTDTRAKIWRSMMPSLDLTKAQTLAARFPDLAGGHIENIARKVTVGRVLHGRGGSWEELTEMCRQELMGSGRNVVVGFKKNNN